MGSSKYSSHKYITNVTSLIGDNCETNKALANLCNVPLIGCASHSFNLAMEMFLLKYKHIIDKTNTLMGKFKNLKLAGKLRLLTSLCAIQRNTTRWSSTSEMIKQYFRLKPFFTQGNFDKMPELIDYMLSARGENDLQLLNETLQKFNSVTIALQRESIDISEVRALFNEIIRHDVNMGTYLSSNADIIHFKTFENALVKILDNGEHKLFLNEKESVNKLLKQSEITPVSIDHDLDFASKLLKKRKLEKMSSGSRYVNCKFLVPTSNIAERFFSAAGYAIGHLRHNILPSNLEMQMFLFVNKRFWDRKMLSDIMMNNENN